MHLRQATVSLAIVIFTFFTCKIAHAASVKAVQNTKVLLELNGDTATEGDLFIAVDPSTGKRLGIIKITKVKGNRALGNIVKGRAAKGWDANPRGKQAARKAPKQEKPSSGPSNLGIGGMVGYAMENQSVTFNTPVFTTNMTGNGFSGHVFGDYNFTDMFGVRGVAGMDMLSVSSNDTCTGQKCSTSITYLTLGGWGRLNFWPGELNPWIGGGMLFLMPMSSDSTAIATDSISSTYAFVLGGGVDWRLDSSMYIPIQFEYALFASSTGVSTNWMALRAGLGFSF